MAKNKFNPPSTSSTKFQGPPVSSKYEHPVFCFKHVQKNFKLSDGEAIHIKQAVSKIERWASMTWQDILQASKTGNGQEQISASSLKVPVPAVAINQGIICTRYNGNNCRMLGFKDKNQVFNVLWFDHHLETYDH